MKKIKMEEIKEKGKVWVEKNRFWLGYAYAFGVVFVGSKVLMKVFEPKAAGIWIDDVRNKKDNNVVALETYYKDRFGNNYGSKIVGDQEMLDWVNRVLAEINDKHMAES